MTDAYDDTYHIDDRDVDSEQFRVAVQSAMSDNEYYHADYDDYYTNLYSESHAVVTETIVSGDSNKIERDRKLIECEDVDSPSVNALADIVSSIIKTYGSKQYQVHIRLTENSLDATVNDHDVPWNYEHDSRFSVHVSFEWLSDFYNRTREEFD